MRSRHNGKQRPPRSPLVEQAQTVSSSEQALSDQTQETTGNGNAANRREEQAAATEPTLRNTEDRDQHLGAEEARAGAASDRAAAARDWKRAAEDREAAASLRAAAARDREQAVRERKLAGIDSLTGVSLRAVGLGEIKREIARARRAQTPLALAFVDVNNLKIVNDTQGHLAGDTLLKQVAQTLRTMLRPYDVIMRFGGDEFVCALANMETKEAQGRLTDIIGTLEANGLAKPISFGVAALEANDDLETLIARADMNLREARRASDHRPQAH
jgi:diguanylate cyclase (GGDEF)-like protein